MKTLETLTFDNAALRDLPVDTSPQNVPRQGEFYRQVANFISIYSEYLLF